ncbi:hypothetical protein ACKLNR_013824 [Fusarium oxysporum f. sp. zingiberi]
MTVTNHSPRKRLYIAGAPAGSSIGPPVQNYIAKQLQKPWNMQFLESKTIQNVIDTFRSPDFAGGLVTMPWKQSIIPYLDEADELVALTGACNLVYLTTNGQLKGTNVDWVGIKIPLLAARPQQGATYGMIYGAGGASRAALYALAVELGMDTIYIINRDDAEVEEFLKDASKYRNLVKCNIKHVKSVQEAETLPIPPYIISTVPDVEAKTPGELEARSILRTFLSRDNSNGVLLDMCYHPRVTRNIQMAKTYGWTAVEGIEAVGTQFRAQWKLWAGLDLPEEVEKMALSLLDKVAQADKTVTPEMPKM